VFSRPASKAQKLKNIRYILYFCNAAGRDEWAQKM